MRETIVGASPPLGAYSPGLAVDGPLLFVSGQGPLRDGSPVGGTVAEQTRLTLDNVHSILRAAGAGLADVVRFGVYLADISTFAEMDAEFAKLIPDPKPARTTIGATLVNGIAVEIDAIAVLRR